MAMSLKGLSNTAGAGRAPIVLWLPLLVLCTALLMTYALWRESQDRGFKELQSNFSNSASDAVILVQQRIQSYEQILKALRGLFLSSNAVDRNEFKTFYASLDLVRNFPGIQGLAFVPLVRSAQKDQHIAAIRREGFAAYDIRPPGQRDIYAPVLFIEPFSGRNLRAFGFDIASETRRREALERARDTNSAAITARVELVQDDEHAPQAGFLILLPVYQHGAALASVEERRANLVGWVDAVIRIEDLMQGVLGNEAHNIDIEIFDSDKFSNQALLYDNDKLYRGDGGGGSKFQATHQLQVAGRTWTLLISSRTGFEKRLDAHKAQLIAMTGVFVSLLLALMTWILMRGRVQSLRAAQALQQELDARKEAEESLRTAALIYENSSEGMLVTDAQNHILAINPAFTRITGYTLDEVKGKNPNILSSGRHDPDFYEVMWHELNHTGRWQGEVWDRRKTGEIHAKHLTINTSHNEDGTVFRRVALFVDISDKKETEEIIWHQANYDELTQLPNRSMFLDRLAQEIKLAQRNNNQFALLFLDLDLFKEVNDTLGHQHGDELLIEAANRIKSCVRDTDTVARLGGDEFTVILSESASVERVAESILAALAAPYTLGEAVTYVSGSIGITLFPRDAKDAEGLLKNADQAMYVAKNMGRNSYSYFTSALQAAAMSRLHLISDMRDAIKQNQFIVHYQPIINLVTGQINKAEALVRWQHPKRGLVSPADFIPIAEEIGLISKIGDWVFHEAAQQAKRLRTLHHPEFQISVNKSPKQFRERGASHKTWLAYLEQMQLPGNSIAIEITEGLLLNTATDVTEKLHAYRAAGVAIAIDDFGTGYSSLAYLKRFDIDYLKIDRSFVRDIETDANDLALSRAIIVMAHALGLKVIAEGVESERQLDLLIEAGCDYAQGYYFAKPIAPDQFEALLQNGAEQQWQQRLAAKKT